MKNKEIINSLENLSSACIKLKEDNHFLSKYHTWIDRFINTIDTNGTIFFCGNGGSFADSQHLATELVVRFEASRRPIKALCLGSNQSNITAIGNDMSFDQIFSRELASLYKNNDTVFILSTSGNSPNVIKVAEYVNNMGDTAIALLGKGGGNLKDITDNFVIPYDKTSLIQELQILIGHCICKEIEEHILKSPS